MHFSPSHMYWDLINYSSSQPLLHTSSWKKAAICRANKMLYFLFHLMLTKCIASFCSCGAELDLIARCYILACNNNIKYAASMCHFVKFNTNTWDFRFSFKYWKILIATEYFEYYKEAVGLFFHSIMNIWWKCRSICWWVCFFMGTHLEKCTCYINTWTHQWMLCSEWVPSEWESRQLIKTSQ